MTSMLKRFVACAVLLLAAWGGDVHAQGAALVQKPIVDKACAGWVAPNLVRSVPCKINAALFNAKGDGATDDTVALNSLFSYTSTHALTAYLSAGTYKITSALTPIVGHKVTIEGDGPNAVISYQGASVTPGDLMTIGDGVTTYTQANISGFRITSTTQLTAGAAIHLKKQSYANVDVIFDGKAAGNGKLYNGLWADASSIIHLHASRFYGKNDAVLANDGVELHLDHAFIEGLGTGNAVHIGGGYGGVYTESTSEIGYNIGLLVDLSVSNVANNQIFVGSGSVFDSNTSAGCYFNDNLAGGKTAYIDGWFASTTAGNACVIINWLNGTFNSSIGKFYNAQGAGSGLVINDTTVKVNLGVAVDIGQNTGYGVTGSSPMTIYSDNVPHNNSLGAYNANITAVHAAQTFNGPVSILTSPTVAWGIDASPATVTVANGASAAIPTGSGMILATNPGNGEVALFLVGGGTVTLVAQAGSTWVSGIAPAAGHEAVGWSGAAYRLYNNYGSSQVFTVAEIRTRAAN